MARINLDTEDDQHLLTENPIEEIVVEDSFEPVFFFSLNDKFRGKARSIGSVEVTYPKEQ